MIDWLIGFPLLILALLSPPHWPCFLLAACLSFAHAQVSVCRPSATSQVVPGAGDAAVLETERPLLAGGRRSSASYPGKNNQGKGTEISVGRGPGHVSAGKSCKRLWFKGSRCCSSFAHCLQLPPPQTVPGWTSSCLPPPPHTHRLVQRSPTERDHCD